MLPHIYPTSHIPRISDQAANLLVSTVEHINTHIGWHHHQDMSDITPKQEDQ